ncbi:MAG: LacI family DNA-binding transcriptional regulator [Mogibacterium sp.]|nr:LacI family DNA-binding transcriptional regulator [Mogibacterium sp.]
MAQDKVTYQDIADYTGFTKTTISRYFNHPETVTEANRAKIRQALDDLGYHSNKIAQILAKGRTEFIGLLIPNLYLNYYAEVLEQFLRAYEKHGYKFLVFSGNGNEETERKYIRELLDYQVEGLIVLSHTISSAELASYHIPVVAFEREDQNVSSVSADNYAGGRAAAELLIRSGCDICLHINNAEPDELRPATRRIAGFLDVCKERGVPSKVYGYPQDNSYQDMRESIDTIAEDIQRTYPGLRKGIFCSNDVIADIILNSILRREGRLTEDYRIVGFDNSTIAEQAVVPISTVGQQLDVMVEAAVELLSRQIEARRKQETVVPEHRMIPPVLIERETT